MQKPPLRAEVFAYVLWKGEFVRYREPKYIVLGELIRRVIRARGALFEDYRGIAVSVREGAAVMLVDAALEAPVVHRWRVSEYRDIPDIIRHIKRGDPYLAGRVFLEGSREWALVDDATLEPSMLFAQEWRLSWGEDT